MQPSRLSSRPPPTFCHSNKEEEPPPLDKKTQVLTNEPVIKSNQALVCNCERTLIDPHHIYFPILQLTIKLSNSLCLLTMLCLTPSRSYWRSLIKRTGRLNSNHRHFVTLRRLAVGHRTSLFYFFVVIKILCILCPIYWEEG